MPDYLREDERYPRRLQWIHQTECDCGNEDCGIVEPVPDGDIVEYADYQRVLQRLVEARRVLANVEWEGGDDDGDARCPCCFMFRDVFPKGHESDCPLAAALEGVERP